MSDWVIENEIPQSNLSSDNHSNEWVAENVSTSQPKESYMESIAQSPLRIGEDIINTALNFVGKIPNYYEKSKTEIPGLLNPIRKHPLHFAGQALAGSQELINQLAQFPKNVSEYGANRLHLIPESVNKFISNITPEDTTEAINQLYGKPQYPGEELARGIVRNIIPIKGAASVASYVNPAKLTSKNIMKDVIRGEGEQLALHNKAYENLFNKAEQLGINKVKFNPKMINLKAIKDYSGKKYYGALEEFLQNPTLKNAQKAQSDLWKLQNELDKPGLTSQQKRTYNAAINARNHIKESMFKDKNGNIIPELKNQYDRIQTSYGKNVIPYTHHEGLQEYKKGKRTAEEVIPSLKKGEFAVKRGKYHPSINRKDKIRNALIGLGITGFGTTGAKSLFDILKGS